MSCILRIAGENFDVDAFVEKVHVPFYQKYYKGEPIGRSTRRKAERSGVNATTSEADFYDFKGQIEDTVEFLTKYKDNLRAIASTPDIDYAVIDFSINSALDVNKLMQTFHFTTDLIRLCAELNISIELSTYKPDMELILEKRRLEKKEES